MNIRRFRALHTAGATYTEIASECGVDPRAVKKYLSVDGVALPPQAPSRAGTQPQMIAPFSGVIDGWLRADLTVKGSVIHERLVADYCFPGSYQRVKMYLARPGDEVYGADPRLRAELHQRAVGYVVELKSPALPGLDLLRVHAAAIDEHLPGEEA